MAKMIAVQMKDPMLKISFLQELKSAYHARIIHDDAPMWLVKQFQTVTADAAVSGGPTLTRPANFYLEVTLKSYSTIVQYLLKRFLTGDYMAKLDGEVCNLR